MKAVVVHDAGGVENLIYQEVPNPKLKENWSIVRIKGFGINHSEIFTREGKSPNVQFPKILGIECVGEIIETTDEKNLPIGQKVISMMGEMGREFNGSYAEYVLLPNEQIYPVNTSKTWSELATIPETYFTAYGSIKKLQIKESDRVLIRGATSGVGIACLKLLKGKYPTLTVDGTSRSLTKVEQLLNVGFSDIIEDKEGQLQTNKKYEKILELIGPKTVKNSFEHIHEEGIVCSTGQLGGKWVLDEFDPIIDTKNAYLTGFYSGTVNGESINELLAFIEEDQIKIYPEKIFQLIDIRKAHEYLESRHSFGKVIILNEE